ncbi:MAG: hypothetical protein QE265_11040 [Rhodoferax sp.]|nr:hypothetical protein [Rhodoferax sp.]
MTDTSLALRHVQRHNQISIRLHYLREGAWHRLYAQHWNERGFCFFHTQPLPAGTLGFKRSLQPFEGELVWTHASQDETQVTEMLLNEAIHRHADRMSSQPAMQQRLMRLMRVQGMADAKRQVLTALGGVADLAMVQQDLRLRMQEVLFQSGVRVDSAVWSAVVADALALGSVVQDLERWSGRLGPG